MGLVQLKNGVEYPNCLKIFTKITTLTIIIREDTRY